MMAKGDLRTGSAPLKEVLKMVIEEMGLGDKMREAELLDSVPEILGSHIMSKVSHFEVRDRKLLLKVSSSPLRHELLLMKDAILQHMNRDADPPLIVDIILR